MSDPLSPEYFSILILDPNKLPKNQNVKKALDQKDYPTYCIFVNTQINDVRINKISDKYDLKWVCDGQYCIATLKSECDYNIPILKIRPCKIAKNIYGIYLCIRDTNFLYIPLDKCPNEEIGTILYRLNKLNSKDLNIHIVCIQSRKAIKKIRQLDTWTYHKLDLKEYCLRYAINFHILLNTHHLKTTYPPVDLDILTQDWSNPNLELYKDINYGLLIYIPNWTLNHLKICYSKDIQQIKPYF